MPCAFCESPGPLTREHVWPRWLHASGDYPLKYHSIPDKVLPAEQVVKDVCAECNNGPLSSLDDYAKSLHNRYFSKGYQSIKNATFKYDFEKLTKWLLKVSYNSARASSAPDVELLRAYARCIITPQCSPAFVGISVSHLGQLIVRNPETGVVKVEELTWCRLGRLELTPSQAALMSARMVIVHSWLFVLAVAKKMELKGDEADAVLSVLRGAILRPGNLPTKVPTIPVSVDEFLKHFRDKEALYSSASSKFRR
jgi:hypothetical protein